jgi:Na+-translocating ferredoxin:NAD+ oxidoreductase subunit G
MEMVLGVFGISSDAKDPNSVFSIYKERITETEQNGLVTYIDKESGGKAILMSGGGFQGNITVVVALNGSKISGFKVVSQVETPGLGARISESAFQESFVGKDVTSGIKMVKTGNAGEKEFDAITGATETSRALEKILNNGFGKYFGNAGNNR